MATSDLTARQSVGFAWQHYYELTKPKVVLLIAFTALVGMLLSKQGIVPWQPMLFGLLGISLAAACGAVVNHIVDQRIDKMMDRTQASTNPQRPHGQSACGQFLPCYWVWFRSPCSISW